AGYKVHYGISSGNYDIIVDVGSQLTFTLPADLVIGTPYFFAVTAYDTDGNESAFSNETTYTAQEAEVALTVNEGDTVNITTTAADPDGDTLTYTYSGWMTASDYTTNYLDAGTHTVTVTVSDGTLSDSHDVTVTVNNVNLSPSLTQIAGINVDTQTTLRWNPNTESNLAGYKVHYGISSGNYDIIVDVGSQLTFTLPADLVIGTPYFFAVTAYDT
ncbi:MAG: fibronectin type III domain-containing protein, partial [Planctomycetes bacterium]|nr:fibronectin type III domain-containing protein [Planctomycetota bacterium]